MWSVTIEGVNKMTSDYFGLELTNEGFDKLYQTLNSSLEFSEYEENDNTLTDTFIRYLIIEVICEKIINIRNWPTYGDSDEYSKLFLDELREATKNGKYIRKV